ERAPVPVAPTAATRQRSRDDLGAPDAPPCSLCPTLAKCPTRASVPSPWDAAATDGRLAGVRPVDEPRGGSVEGGARCEMGAASPDVPPKRLLSVAEATRRLALSESAARRLTAALPGRGQLVRPPTLSRAVRRLCDGHHPGRGPTGDARPPRPVAVPAP